MNQRIFYSEYFYQKGSKDTGVLERNASEYPYSALASFLLLYHYKKTSNPAFETFAKKTALLFNNPQWLQFQLFDQSAPNSGEEIINDGNVGQEIAEGTTNNNEIPLENSPAENVPEESAPNSEREIISEENFQQDSEERSTDNNEIPIEPSSTENVTEESAFSIAHVDKVEEVNNNSVVESQVQETLDHETEKQENSEEAALSNSLQTNEIVENKNILNETATTGTAISENPVAEKIEAENENATSENEPITFEPLHAVDYFASQGIKITDELLSNDKLGSQMKSFTDWLKSMKKLHPGKLEEQSLAAEKLIQASANESNSNTEILTEAMAEVLIKQDKRDKAIEMFSKLSLINPSKSAYFAARIESIKSN